jgi:uncharacterized protein YfaQ (DUF2300 family)
MPAKARAMPSARRGGQATFSRDGAVLFVNLFGTGRPAVA